MDLEYETELDYEEELEFSVNENKSPQGTLMGNSKKPNESSLCCDDDDQYLQIDYLEEDENLIYSNVPSGTLRSSRDPSQTEVNTGVVCGENTIFNQGKNHFMRKYEIHRSCKIPYDLKSEPLSHFRQPFGKNNNTIKKFSIGQLANSTVQNNRSQRPNDQNSVHFLSNPSVQQFQSGVLSVLNEKFKQLQPFSSPNFDFPKNQHELVRDGNAQSQTSDSSIRLKYSSSRKNTVCPNSVSGNIDNNSNSEATKSQRDTFRNRPSVNAKKDFIDNSDFSHSQKYKKIAFNKEINSNEECNFSSKCNEKELVRLKRVARLIRFRNENSFKRSKTECKTYHENLYFEDEYFRKMEEQKHKRQKIFELKEKQGHVHNPKGGEETLLKEIYPFCVNSGVTHILDKKIKKEVKYSEKEETENYSLKKGLHIIKCDFDSNVKFTRTISKTYEEMSLSRCSDKETTNTEAKSISIQAKKEIQSNGCIVKVLNLPQVTTSDVFALCSPIEKPLEVKLSVIKEEAVIIKFANPIYAANFYSLYHGVKVNGDFLNVTIF